MAKFIVEHMEEELFDWCKLEYAHMAEFIPKDSLIFTNLESLPSINAITHKEKISQLMHLFPKEDICLLDSESDQILQPEDAAKFKYFLLGGILGNVDEWDEDRTKELRKEGYATRNLGRVQMTTDTALLTAHMIVERGEKFEDLEFVDRPEIEVEKGKEKIVLEFRFLKKNDGSAEMAKGIAALLLKENTFFE